MSNALMGFNLSHGEPDHVPLSHTQKKSTNKQYHILRRKVAKPRDILSNKDICNQFPVKWRQALGARSVVCGRGMSWARQ